MVYIHAFTPTPTSIHSHTHFHSSHWVPESASNVLSNSLTLQPASAAAAAAAANLVSAAVTSAAARTNAAYDNLRRWNAAAVIPWAFCMWPRNCDAFSMRLLHTWQRGWSLACSGTTSAFSSYSKSGNVSATPQPPALQPPPPQLCAAAGIAAGDGSLSESSSVEDSSLRLTPRRNEEKNAFW